MLVLDTNHVTEIFFRSSQGERLISRLASANDEVVTTVITVEESLRGWLAEIRRHGDALKQIPAYSRFMQQVELFGAWLVLPWDRDAAERYETLLPLKHKVGAQDLKIACITLAHGATLLTRNTKHFSLVPGLKIANWLD